MEAGIAVPIRPASALHIPTLRYQYIDDVMGSLVQGITFAG